ncbi:hypothetical protein D2E64_11475 [Mycobacteroides abscessus]|uniref:hypothetical protein n=1 Tax=Mycobacteroides abscessus TaxID=36809 RepID=UPI000D3E48DF|nr:hypothetical protein [Mycobacteroides abscessus]PVA72280.1 hypothetical protein DDJ76_23055 [Mycobacteroides abscessus]RIS03952.1 hypothetical protein D2E63_22675 [Mycobacteroides abscessus]RIS11292.1 hypothetical protein D2E69_22135 [Mycobacteroides abscessus]RIS23604.1 hypothetical protein D2E67_22320 [Mycobacteroides abscessus]RIT15750.1 hypothetical protein D2E64_11475 [Mycobacteroides abscessus]
MSNNCFSRSTRIMTTAALGAAALAIAAAPAASAGPAEGPNALEVILQLQRQGDKVIIDRSGNKPLQMCTVTSIRQIDAQYWWSRPHLSSPKSAIRPNAQGTQLIERTIYVTIRC